LKQIFSIAARNTGAPIDLCNIPALDLNAF